MGGALCDSQSICLEDMNYNRRTILKSMLTGVGTMMVPACAFNEYKGSTGKNVNVDWLRAKSIRANTQIPEFPDKAFVLTDFAEVGENFDYSQAFKKGVETCHDAGGGRLIVPAGTFHTGPIHLLSNVNLHLEKGARIKFIPEPARYLPAVVTRWEGLELMGYSPLIYAYQQTNIAVTGEGVLDGSADAQTWWPWKGAHKERLWDLTEGEDQKPARAKLMADAQNRVPIDKRLYADGAYLRPPFIQPHSCERVLIEGVTIKDSPFWLLNPVLCNQVTVRGVSFLSLGPNSDGCNPESCDHVVIENCIFDTGDDCIAIKSGRNEDGRRIGVPSQNIVIANCQMREGHGGVVIGSEISGGVNNVFVENCQMDSPHLERAIRIKTNSVRGGLIEHLRYRDITVGKVKNAIVINFYYEEGDAGRFDPTVRDIVIENLYCQKVLQRPMNLQGFERKPIHDFHLVNCHFKQADELSIVRNVKNITFDNVSINNVLVNPNTLKAASV